MRLLFTAFLICIGFAAQAQYQNNYYTVKFPDDQTVYGCGVIPDVVQPVITQYGNCNFNVGVSMQDQTFYTNSNHTCYKILRTWTLLYWCDYNPNWAAPYFVLNPMNTDVGPTVIGNSINHGYISYQQVIKVVDNVPPVFLKCPTEPVVFCDYTGNDATQYNTSGVDKCEGPVNLQVAVTDACSKADVKLSYRLYLDLDCNGSMETYVSSSSPNAWPIETTVTADTLYGKIKFPTGFGLPYATHKIEWIANDNCAADAVCKYSFIVKDCKAPTVVCMNGLSINIMQTGMITLWDTDFLQYTNDNCTPTNQIKIAIRKAGTGTGFPANNHSVTFDCTELGPQQVEIWAQDAYGNADYCLTYVIVQDHSAACPTQSMKGAVATAQAQAVPGVSVKLKSNMLPYPGSWSAGTDANGEYTFTGTPMSGQYSLIPKLDINDPQGVTTLDALMASAHVTGIQALASPYQIIAADAHADAVLNDLDVQEIMKVATGQDTVFANNTSWRFVPATYQFANPALPLATPFAQQISLVLPGSHDFVAIKTGDVDDSALASSVAGNSADRSGTSDPIYFGAPDRTFTAGEQVKVEVVTPDLDGVSGFQFTMGYDLAALHLDAVEPGLVPAEQIGNFPEKGALTAGWYLPEVLTGAGGKNQKLTAFTLVFTAQQDGDLKTALNMNATVATPECYDAQLQTRPAALQFTKAKNNGTQALLYPPQPNPASQQTTAVFYVPQDGDVNLRLMDARGQVLLDQTAFYAQGLHRQVLDLSSLGAGENLLLLQLRSGDDVQVVKLLKM